MLVLAIADLRMLLRTADIAAAMSVEGQLGTDRVFAAELQALRPHPGQALSAANLTALLADSGVVASHRGPRLQPGPGRLLAALLAAGARRRPRHRRARRARSPAASSPRPSTTRSCSPMRAGSSPTATSTARPVAYVLDFLAIVAADVASISERRTDRFLDKARNHGLPPFLADDPGRRQRPHDRAVHPGRDRLGAEAARGPGLGRLDPVVARCRRTTSRWAGRPPASCAARSTA